MTKYVSFLEETMGTSSGDGCMEGCVPQCPVVLLFMLDLC